MKKILLISNMYPSESEPSLGAFVKNITSSLANVHSVELNVIDYKTTSKIKKILSYCSFYFSIIKTLMRKKFDFIYLHFASHSSLPVILLTMLGMKFNIVTHVHGGDIKYLEGRNRIFFSIKKVVVKKILQISTKIIVPSKHYAEYLQEHYGSFDNIVIYPSGGVNIDVFKELAILKKKDVIGYAGRLVKSKNVSLLIQSLKKFPFLKLEIVGEGEELANLKKLVEELNLSNQVSFLKGKSQKDLSEWFNQINCLVYPSSSESLGLVPIEAMACGTHVILSEIPAFLDLREVGFTFNSSRVADVTSLEHSIQKLYDSSEDELNLSITHNKQLVNSIYSHKMVDKVLKDVFK
ncbi:LPS biosynthesis protein RfbU [Psychromonas marina]|uniref:LPS biosynthesis protein RfbU n=1 Tax=Psychromonas marina TaxID=88364 RepID=A0ABQ6DV86_9GAMM|nr:glycosyltransferase family 4 protein [Psychromonas marina]GLS89027.1 LPS biosynthesis protein RfbU [Psychromonas marina]